MIGCFGEYDVEDILSMCMKWLPVHAWGHATTKGNLIEVAEINSFSIMQEKLHDLIKNEQEKNMVYKKGRMS